MVPNTDNTLNTTPDTTVPADGTALPAVAAAPAIDPTAPELPANGPTTADTTGPGEATLNFDVLNAADADPAAWGQELARFLAVLTGKFVDSGSLSTLFGAYATQVQADTYRKAAVTVANATLTASSKSKEVLIAQMDTRSDLAELLLATVA